MKESEIISFYGRESYYENNDDGTLRIVTRTQNFGSDIELPFNVLKGIVTAEVDGVSYHLIIKEGNDFPGWGGSYRAIVRGGDYEAAVAAAKKFNASDVGVSWS